MIRTSERLRQGASLYYQQFTAKVSDEKRNYPTVNYPNKVERCYFQRINQLSGSKIEVIFLQRTYYKKVEGYRQVNYQKYRILSGTLYKEKYVSIKLDLTPTSLNNLRYHGDSDISRNALGIISAINQVDCYPSWAQTEFLNLVHKKSVEKINNDAKAKRTSSDSSIKNEEARKKANKSSIEAAIKNEKSLKENLLKVIAKSIDAGFAEHKIIKAILTLGIYNLYRIHKHSKVKAEKIQTKLDNAIKRKESLINESHKIEDQLVSLKNARAELEAEIAYLLKIEEQQHALDNSNISQPFSESFINNPISKDPVQLIKSNYEYNVEKFEVEKENLNGFVDLKNENIKKLEGLDVIGVFAIRNTESGSLYIGFSLDVEKSINEMFSNYIPTNALMLKEYKESKVEDKTLLFEIKIRMVKTKEELLKEYKMFDKVFNGRYVRY